MTDNHYEIKLHDLRKLGFIPLRGNSTAALKELITLVNSYDDLGIYELKQDVIHFKLIEKQSKILLSYLECSGTKAQRGKKCADGFQCEEIEFRDLEKLLQDDYAYSPFKFMNGHRGADNIASGCKWLVLDVDDADITDEEAHILLSDINHFIARTSNKDIATRFRVLLELDSELDIPNTSWSKFLTILSADLGLEVDKVAKSQIFFSYKDREILSNLEGKPLAIKPYLTALAEYTSKKVEKKLSVKAANELLNDPFTTFDKAFEAKDGEGRRKLIWAIKRARELGCTKEYAKDLLIQINNYWVSPLADKDLEVMLNQIDRWVFNGG